MSLKKILFIIICAIILIISLLIYNEKFYVLIGKNPFKFSINKGIHEEKSKKFIERILDDGDYMPCIKDIDDGNMINILTDIELIKQMKKRIEESNLMCIAPYHFIRTDEINNNKTVYPNFVILKKHFKKPNIFQILKEKYGKGIKNKALNNIVNTLLCMFSYAFGNKEKIKKYQFLFNIKQVGASLTKTMKVMEYSTLCRYPYHREVYRHLSIKLMYKELIFYGNEYYINESSDNFYFEEAACLQRIMDDIKGINTC